MLVHNLFVYLVSRSGYDWLLRFLAAKGGVATNNKRDNDQRMNEMHIV